MAATLMCAIYLGTRLLYRDRAMVNALHPSSNLLKVGHHGCANATTSELLTSVKPEFAIISVSGNSFGVPRTEILGRLANVGASVYRTDVDGAVTFYLDGHSVTPSVAALQGCRIPPSPRLLATADSPSSTAAHVPHLLRVPE